jgi:hypothetical protein
MNDFFGHSNQFQKDAAQHYDEILEKKLEKNFNIPIFTSTSRMYLWSTVAYLLSLC